MIEPADWIGRQIGKYRITRLIGRGGTGSVFEGVDRHLKRPVAIKLLPAEPDTLPRLLREARTAARVSHPNVVAVYDVGRHQQVFFLVMELIRGRSAFERVRDSGPFSETEAAGLVMSICKGLRAAHAAGLIHRDIKPGNILCPQGGEAQLVDFGLAKPALESGGRLTQVNTLLGTPHFMSPEQCRCEPLDERSDLYSLGATWYFLLTGRPPFDSPDPFAVLFAHCSDPTPDPRTVNPAISEETVRLLRRALAKNRSDRFTDAHAMHQAIAYQSKETPVLILPPEPEAPSVMSRRRRRIFDWRVAIPVVVVVAGIVWAVIARGGRATNPAEKPEPVKAGPVSTPPARKPDLREFPYVPITADPGQAIPFWHLKGLDGGSQLGKFFPESSRFATSDMNSALSVWMPPSNRFHRLKPPTGGIIDLAGGNAGQWLAVTGNASVVTIFAAPDWKAAGIVNAQKSPVTSLAAHNSWLAAATREGLQFYDMSRFPVTQPVNLPGSPTTGVILLKRNREGSRLAAVDASGFLSLWDTVSGD